MEARQALSRAAFHKLHGDPARHWRSGGSRTRQATIASEHRGDARPSCESSLGVGVDCTDRSRSSTHGAWTACRAPGIHVVAAANATVRALSPQPVPSPTRLPPWEVFQRGPWSRQCATCRRDPHQKTFTGAALCGCRSSCPDSALPRHSPPRLRPKAMLRSSQGQQSAAIDVYRNHQERQWKLVSCARCRSRNPVECPTNGDCIVDGRPAQPDRPPFRRRPGIDGRRPCFAGRLAAAC